MNGNGNYLFNYLYLNAAEINKALARLEKPDDRPRTLDDFFGPVSKRFPKEFFGIILSTLDAEPYRGDLKFVDPLFYTGASHLSLPRRLKKKTVDERMVILKKFVREQNRALERLIENKLVINSIRTVNPSYENDLLVGRMTFARLGLNYSPRDDLVRNLALYFLKEQLCIGYDVKSSFFYPSAGPQMPVISSAFALSDELKSTALSSSPASIKADGMAIFRAAERYSYAAMAVREKERSA